VPNALIAEHHLPIRKVMRLHLAASGFDVVECADGMSALRLLRRQPFDLIVLDVMLPGLDGLSVCRMVRSGGTNADSPILMVTDRDVGSGRAFDIREFMARTAALTRRCPHAPPREEQDGAHTLSNGPVTIEVEKRRVMVRGRAIALTRQEFAVLHRLAARRGMVFSRAALLQNVWKKHRDVTERTVDSVISRLRQKIELDPRAPELILTAWGIGYKFADAS
jgi:DNA-binding response OmpR family regulator